MTDTQRNDARFMPEAPSDHFLQRIFADMRARADQPVLCEKQGEVFHLVTLREVATRVGSLARALHAAGVMQGDRVAFYAGADAHLLIFEWAVLACQGISVIVPRSFAAEELDETLIESKARVVVVDRTASAWHLADKAESFPDLRHIVCLEGGAEGKMPISSLPEFIDSGRMEPDRFNASLRAIAAKDTALMFYYKDAGALKAERYSHGQLLETAARIEQLLGKSAITISELVVTATVWEHPVGHIASCYAPLLKGAVVQLTHGIASAALFENQPQVVVGDAAFFSDMRSYILQTSRHAGHLESFLLEKALALSKQNYEAPRTIGPLSRLFFMALKASVIAKVKRALGGKLRLFIGIDDEAHYETQVFFQAFGVELVELPQEAFK